MFTQLILNLRKELQNFVDPSRLGNLSEVARKVEALSENLLCRQLHED